MSDLQIFAMIGIVAAFVVAIAIPQMARVAPLSMIHIFAMVSGLLAASMGFLAFTTNWHDQDAWRSAVLLLIGGLIACFMVKRSGKRDWQSGN
jgi:hypothetical protein